MKINYKHLNYFWHVAKTGSIINASEALHITPQTISGQLSLLEESIGDKLFERQGRRLLLSNKGKAVYKYADRIFSLGEELNDFLRGSDSVSSGELRVGIMDGIPKIIAYKILCPVIDDKTISLTCHEGSFEQLIAKLAIRELDMVISDMPVNSAYSIRAYNHKLGESPMTCFAIPALAKKLKRNFPDSLDHTPVLLPTNHSTIRPAIDQWFMTSDITPTVVGEFDDSALLKAFGESGAGVFFMPTIIESEVQEHYGVSIVGRTENVREQFFALTLERKLDNSRPIVTSLVDQAISSVFT